MSELQAVTPEMDEDELTGKDVITARGADSPEDIKEQGFMHIKYIDDEVVLYKNVDFDRENHGMEKRDIWNKNVEEGFYKIVGEEFVDDVVDIKENGKLEDLLCIKGVGNSTLDSLEDMGFENVSDVTDSSPKELMEVSGIGKKIVERIREEFGGLEGEITYPSQTKTTSTVQKKNDSTSNNGNSGNSSNNNNNSNGDTSSVTTDSGKDVSPLVQKNDSNDWSMSDL